MNAPATPYDDTMGFVKTVRAPGDVVIELDVDARHHNPMGVLHGGVLIGMMDSAMGNNTTMLLESDQTTTNAEMQIRLLSPVKQGHLTAEAKVLQRTKKTILWEATVTHEEQVVARATSTFVIMK